MLAGRLTVSSYLDSEFVKESVDPERAWGWLARICSLADYSKCRCCGKILRPPYGVVRTGYRGGEDRV